MLIKTIVESNEQPCYRCPQKLVIADQVTNVDRKPVRLIVKNEKINFMKRFQKCTQNSKMKILM